jgi:hypothetical protein
MIYGPFVSGCWGKIVQLRLLSPDSHEIVVNIDNWGIVEERRCGSSTDDIPVREIPERIAAWEKSNAEYHTLADRIRASDVNLSYPAAPDDAVKIYHILNS